MNQRILLLVLLGLLFDGLYAIDLTFRVDMSEQVQNATFNPVTETVDIAGNFNGWGNTYSPMQDNNNDNIWEITLSGFTVNEIIEFKFRINGQWNGREEFPGTGNNRVYTVPASHATLDLVYNKFVLDPGPSSPKDLTEVEWWNDAVFYEIFVRSFYDSDGDGIGDFQGLIQKLDYLNDGDPTTDTDLGITGIWLMPISPSPSYHGYDVTDYRGIEPDYGTMADFREFLDSAHARGIRVIIDYVLNHSSDQHPWFVDAKSSTTSPKRDWYRWVTNSPGYQGPWGQNVWHWINGTYYYGVFWGGMPDLNYETPAVKTEMFDIADYWLKDIGVDGFRLDAVKYLYEDGASLENTQATFDFFQDFRTHYKATQSDAFTVGEAWTSTDQVVRYVENGRLDYCFEFDLASAMLNAVNSGDATYLNFQMQRVYNSYPYLQWGSFLTNHDQNRVMDVLQNDPNKAKTAAALYLTLPGVPYVYYGEEIGMNGTKPDEDIRRPMQWTAGSQAGFSSQTPWNALNSNYTSVNVANQQATSGSLWQWYRDLIAIREDAVPLRRGYYSYVPTNHASVHAFMRDWEGDTVIVAINLSSQAVSGLELDLPYGYSSAVQVYDYVQAQSTQLSVTSSGFLSLNAPAYSTQIYAFGSQPLSAPVAETATVSLFPNPASDWVRVQLPQGDKGAVRYQLMDLTGRQILQGKAPSSTFSLEVQDLQAGIYLLQFQQGGRSFTHRILIQR